MISLYKIHVYTVNKTFMEKTFYMLVNVAFDVSVCGLLSSMFYMQNKVNFFK